MSFRPFAWISILVLAFAASVFAQQIRGDYIETRSGNQAILAWHVQSGSWDGVPLSGLTVAAAVRANGTLGDPYENPYPAHAVLLVDAQANEQQRTALIAFAQQMGGELLRHVEKVIPAPVQMLVNHQQHGVAVLRAGQFATVQTRAIGSQDHICGNEATFYPPLTELAHSMPAVAVTDSYQGPALGVDWESHGKSSAFVGTFAR
jgi:hypothetical protein